MPLHSEQPEAEPVQPQTALDVPIWVTVFRDKGASQKTEQQTTLRKMVGGLKVTRAPSKAQLPWLKLATFGHFKTEKNSYRNDANVVDIFGAEADYDGETITMDRAAHVITNANVGAVIYSSPSNKADAPRWRILCATSRRLSPQERAGMVARLNGLFVGALARESFTLSQAYYYGAIEGATDHRVITVEGRCIDLCDELDEGALFPTRQDRLAAPAAPVAPRSLGTGWNGGTPYGRRALENECNAIRNAGEGEKHHALNKAAWSIGGLVSAGELDEGAALAELRGALSDIRSRCVDYEAAQRTLEGSFEAGKGTPRKSPPPLVKDEPPPPLRHMMGVPLMPQAEEVDLETGEILEPAVKAPVSPIWIDPNDWTAAAIPPRPWVVKGYLMRGSVAVLSGQGAGGKSSLMVRWTIALALGEAVGEFEPSAPCKVVNYNVEDDRDEQLRRYSAGLISMKRQPSDIAGKVIRCGPAEIGTLFERDQATGRVTPTPAMDALERLCVETGASVLVCDPLAELHNAEENDNTAMRAVVAAFRGMAQRLGIAVMVLHHDRKGNNAPGDMDRMRGASAITGAVRVMLTLTTMSQEEADKFGIAPEDRRRHFRIDGAKSNYAIAQDAEWWKLEGYEIPNGEIIAACAPWTPPATFDDFGMEQCVAVLDAMHRGTARGFAWAVAKNTGDDWAGNLITKLGKTAPQAKQILKAWEEAGTITADRLPSPRTGQKREAYVVNLDAVSQMRQQIKGKPA
jgi:hypothetical protein